MKNRIVKIGLDGPNRVGKGTQIELLKDKLELIGIPVIIVRGDGSRPNSNSHIGDLYDPWWEITNKSLRNNDIDNVCVWRQAAIKLAYEMLEHEQTTMPLILKRQKKNLGIILIDRSLLSRIVFELEFQKRIEEIELYPNTKDIDLESLMPDILFNLVAPKEILLNRLKPDDPKFEFRKRLIETKSELYYQAPLALPFDLRKRVVTLEQTNIEPENLFEIIWEYVGLLIR